MLEIDGKRVHLKCQKDAHERRRVSGPALPRSVACPRNMYFHGTGFIRSNGYRRKKFCEGIEQHLIGSPPVNPVFSHCIRPPVS